MLTLNILTLQVSQVPEVSATCETCSQSPVLISAADFANAIQTPTCPECGRTVPADEAWEVVEPMHPLPEPSPEVMAALAALDGDA